MSKDDNKIVPFPTHKIKKPVGADKKTLGQMPPLPERKKTFFVSLVATILVSTWLTSRLNLSQNSTQERGLASAERDVREDIALAKKIARDTLREPASPGLPPTTEENFRHGVMGDGYSLQFQDGGGGLRSVEFVSAEMQKLRQFADRSAFLIEYADLFRVEFTHVKLSESIQDDNADRVHEVYELYSGEMVRAKAYITVDKQNRVYLIKVDPAAQ